MTDTRPARPTREQETRTERRRRGDVDTGMRKRLPVDESKLDHNKFVYRWANDDAARMRDLTGHDDYDPVPEEDVGGATKVTVGPGENGGLRGTVLLRKPRHFWEEDQKKKDASRDRNLEVLKAGKPAADESGGGLEQDRAYVPRSAEYEQTLDGRKTYTP